MPHDDVAKPKTPCGILRVKESDRMRPTLELSRAPKMTEPSRGALSTDHQSPALETEGRPPAPSYPRRLHRSRPLCFFILLFPNCAR